MGSVQQHLRSPAPSAPGLRSLVFLLGALALPAVFAAGPTGAASAKTGEALGLKLDLGFALGQDDCEEDYADLVTVGSARGAGSGALPAGRGEAMLAKLSASFDPNAAQGGAMPAQAVPAAAVRPEPAVQVQAAAAAAVPAAAPAAPVQTWEIVPADKTLNAALSRWAAAAGWQLLWELPVDYSVDARTTIQGNFEEAVTMVARSMESAEIPMKAIFYNGNRVLRIVARGAE